ncbi:ScbR family autoregulator-binding transcription factor [Streptomyces ipomoeae]|uniref:ScbR family autoregulator-binding transcription factor n=1 Tax=Streptomyces ipomoeae TaxID=103232 RepID=UPI0011476154|nr:ScbR family autoregulator-binding transcription factor [Streptomyces ipomoeae]MDX2934619.1 ScbR family autoregulator-binding transcription factor [Streptomyces ipomoeae]TQE19015.1 TetR/AcrR family transcriptional regulator [Streptomyces ipomoeae]
MPRQERAERTHEVIVRAAAVCFDTTGFTATSLGDIAETAKVSKGALYFHFSSKEKLAEAVAARSGADWRGILRAARAPDGPMLQMLIDMTHGLAHRIRHDVVFRAGLRLCDDRRPGEDPYPSPYQSWRRATAHLLARADRRGELLPGLDLGHAVRLLTATAAGVEMLSRQDRGWLTTKTVAGVWSALLPALVPAEQLDRFRPHGRATPTLPVPRRPSPIGVGGRTGN